MDVARDGTIGMSGEISQNWFDEPIVGGNWHHILSWVRLTMYSAAASRLEAFLASIGGRSSSRRLAFLPSITSSNSKALPALALWHQQNARVRAAA
jgi:hypothetical protein